MGNAFVDQLHRRRNAAQRLTILECGCADPWTHSSPSPLSDHQLDGWALAAGYILETTGHAPVLPVDVLRRLWHRGGDDRALAEKIRNATRGAAA